MVAGADALSASGAGASDSVCTKQHGSPLYLCAVLGNIMADICSISIVVPALNEEESLGRVIDMLNEQCSGSGIGYEIIIVNDGSKDGTATVAGNALGRGDCHKYIEHKKTMGIGASFRDGAISASKDIVTWIPADGENNVGDLLKYLPMFETCDIVVPYVINKSKRSILRRMLSSLYLIIINLTFKTRFRYTNGNVMYKRKVLLEVINRANGFFFQTECLINALKTGYTYAEVPVSINARQKSRSKALSVKNTLVLLKDFLRLSVKNQ